MTSPRTKERRKSIGCFVTGFILIPTLVVFLPWTPWFWLTLPVVVGCGILGTRAAYRADRTYGWPMPPEMQQELWRRADTEIRRIKRGG